MGLVNVRRVSDEFEITSKKSSGTTVKSVIYIEGMPSWTLDALITACGWVPVLVRTRGGRVRRVCVGSAERCDGPLPGRSRVDSRCRTT
jgi:hypothetical protein